MSGLISLMLSTSAVDKLMGSGHALQMATSFGLSADTYWVLGIIELLSVVLFVYPRTGILGTLLLSSYLGGAIATHLQHQQDIAFPAAIEVFIWLTAIIRFGELTARLLNKSVVNNQVS